MIKENAIICRWCHARIVSRHRHDFNSHVCETLSSKGAFIAADGGKEYLRRVGDPEDYIDVSIIEDE